MIPIEYPPVWTRAWRFVKRLFCKRRKIGNFESFIFPVIKNINYQSAAKDLIQVQPMNVPAGNSFYMDFKYGVKKEPWYKCLKVWIFGKPTEGCCRR